MPDDPRNDPKRTAKPWHRPLPYERRAKKAGAGIVNPNELPPASAKLWRKWSLAEAERQGQAEMFAGDLGESPERAAERENRRLCRAAGVHESRRRS